MRLIKLVLISSTLSVFGCNSGGEGTINPVSSSSENGANGFFKNGESIPYFGPLSILAGDTAYYQIPKFSLTDQDSLDLGYANFENKVMVVDFFFTTCSTICPIMTDGLVGVQSKLQSKGLQDKFNFLSVTIDPEVDSPAVLKDYAAERKANLSNWKFATAEIDYIDKLSKEGFFLAVDRDAAYQDGIIHSSQVILVDQNRHVRGSYDAIDENELSKLLEDIIELTNGK